MRRRRLKHLATRDCTKEQWYLLRGTFCRYCRDLQETVEKGFNVYEGELFLQMKVKNELLFNLYFNKEKSAVEVHWASMLLEQKEAHKVFQSKWKEAVEEEETICSLVKRAFTEGKP